MEVKGLRFDETSDKHPSDIPGAYGKDLQGRWCCRAPVPKHFFGGNLSGHKVEEHEDGTITVEPSIVIKRYDGHWHGTLVRGVWTTLPDTKIPPRKEAADEL